MTAPQPKWPRATAAHEAKVKELILGLFSKERKSLFGGVHTSDVESLRTYDLLDFAATLVVEEQAGAQALKPILTEAAPPGTEFKPRRKAR